MPTRRLLLLCAALIACAPIPTEQAAPSRPIAQAPEQHYSAAPFSPAPSAPFLPGRSIARQRADPTDEPTPTQAPTAQPTQAPTPTPRIAPRASSAPKTQPTQRVTVYVGTARFWYPDAGIGAGWGWYGCSKADPSVLPAGIWRWRCNPETVYLLSHAWSTFLALRVAYHAGKVNPGDVAWFADEGGTVSRWAVAWVRLVDAAYFDAHNGEFIGGPGEMTLQTCDGSANEWRLVVRLR